MQGLSHRWGRVAKYPDFTHHSGKTTGAQDCANAYNVSTTAHATQMIEAAKPEGSKGVDSPSRGDVYAFRQVSRRQ